MHARIRAATVRGALMLIWCMASNTAVAAARRPEVFKLIVAFGIIYFVWGSTFLAIRFAVETMPPLLMMGTRHLGAGSLLLVWLLARGHKLPEPRLWLSALFAGAFCFLGCHGLLAWAEVRVPSGLAALLSSTLPIWMVLLAHYRGQGSELTPRILAGIALGFLGVGVLVPITFAGGPRDVLSALAIVLCEVFWAVGAIYSRGVKTTASPAVFAAMQMLSGGVLLWLVGLAFGEGSRLTAAAFTPRSVISLAFLIVFGSVIAFSVYTWLLQVSSPAVVSTHSYVNPLVAVFLGWMMAGESVTPRTLAGTAIILGSVALISGRRLPRLRPRQA
jgi:drug/metabolite transporter (DMT)-like permease